MLQKATHLILALLLLGLFGVSAAIVGCGREDGLSNPALTDQSWQEASETAFMAPPTVDIEQKGKWIKANPGGQISLKDGTRLDVPNRNLDQDTYITITRKTNNGQGRIDFEFEPHGLVFKNLKKLPRLELSWSTLKDVTDPSQLVLYYYDEDTGQWRVESKAQFKGNEKKAILKIPHFSRYYFERR